MYKEQMSIQSLFKNLNIKDSSSTIFQEPKIIPYAGIQGEWVLSKQFGSNSKTFGHYKCNYCDKTWMSAHSKRSFKQGCKGCNRYFYPTHLWKNLHKKKYDNQQKKALEDNKKPHMSQLCQACKKGVCVL